MIKVSYLDVVHDFSHLTDEELAEELRKADEQTKNGTAIDPDADVWDKI